MTTLQVQETHITNPQYHPQRRFGSRMGSCTVSLRVTVLARGTIVGSVVWSQETLLAFVFAIVLNWELWMENF